MVTCGKWNGRRSREEEFMAGVNKVILIGNLGADPEVKYLSSGTTVANFRIATTENRVSRSGEKTASTEWHRIVAFGRLAEICGNILIRENRSILKVGFELERGRTRTGTRGQPLKSSQLGCKC
jgi:single-strand DNA-binding protein